MQRDGRTRYAFRNTRALGKVFCISMHHVIRESYFGRIPDGFTIDHADQDGLNNQIANLRLATQSQQARNQRIHRRNTSGFRGVTWDIRLGCYKAQVRTGELYFLGRYPTAVEAAIAYNHASLKIGGEFAWINPIPAGMVSREREAEIIADIDGRYLPRIATALAESVDRIHMLCPDGRTSNHRVRRDSKTGYRGVTKETHMDWFRASIRHKNELIFLGNYKIKEEAAVAYNHAAFRILGDQAKQNLIPADAVSQGRREEIIALVEARYLARAMSQAVASGAWIG